MIPFGDGRANLQDGVTTQGQICFQRGDEVDFVA
jgi:hypothetical protein